MVEIEFNYQGEIIIIQSNMQDKLSKIFQIFANKANIDVNSVYFLYSGSVIEGNSIVKQQINSTDKKRKKMNILVNKRDDINQTIKIIKPKDISCPKCGELCKINITDYKILLQCKNGHNKGNILIDEYKYTQQVNISNIICGICKINNKGNTYNNVFYKCNSCNINLCPLCKDVHDIDHRIINYEEKYYICIEHNIKFNSYCETCQKNLCLYCEVEHNEKKHKIINFGKILPKVNEADNYIKE